MAGPAHREGPSAEGLDPLVDVRDEVREWREVRAWR